VGLDEASYGKSAGTYSYSLLTGEQKLISKIYLTNCFNDFFFGYDSSNGPNPNHQIYRFSLQDPTGQPVARLPTHQAADGSQQLYALEHDPNDFNTTRLWYSADAGLTWQERGQEFKGSLQSIAVCGSNAGSLYGLKVTYGFNNTSNSRTTDFTLYFSFDTGKSWQERYHTSIETGPYSLSLYVTTLPGKASPVDTVLINQSLMASSLGSSTYTSLSRDGGKTFTLAGENYAPEIAYVQLIQLNKGILRLYREWGKRYQLSLLAPNSSTWQEISLPFKSDLPNLSAALQQDPTNPDNFFLIQDISAPVKTSVLWYFVNSAQQWRQFTQPWHGEPFTLLNSDPNMLVALTRFSDITFPSQLLLVRDGRIRTDRVAPNNNTPGNLYFPSTGHNLSGVFKTYWQSHGGLAQFGYPWTEVFQELNPSDGKFYQVQYFERNRFEYHPELAGTPYEVLLGLLGNQLTTERRQAGDPAFKPISNPNQPGELYFPEVGHSLKGKFKDYWQANGGLAMYGYPISQEFQEINPDDGHTYTVQYFERNRFEYHPELAGTRYEVLLGLLGKTLLLQKAWLPILLQ
jgi:hypothetical protein